MSVLLADGFPGRRDYITSLLAALAGVLLLALMAGRFVNHMPLYDELLHILAARGMNEHGTPQIAGGTYPRALLFTWLVSQSTASLGDTLVAARMPSLLASFGLITVMAIWLTRRVGVLAGFAAAVFLCLVPTTLDLAVFSRFYTLHALLILIVALLAYEAAVPGRSWKARLGFAGIGMLLLLPAIHLQVTTLIAFLGIGAGVTCVLLMDHWATTWRVLRQYPLRIVGGLLVLAAISLFAAASLGLVETLRSAPVWASGAANRPMYYLVKLAADLPMLWPLFPVAAFLAFRRQPRLTAYCVVLLVVVLAIHSLAGSKALRYVYYALPFFCIIWGLAVFELVLSARQLAASHHTRLNSGAALVAMLLVLLLSLEGQRALKLVLGRMATADTLSYAGEANWTPAVKLLEPLVSDADRLVTSNAMKALYYLHRYDYELNVSIVAETDTALEFGNDPRTGRQAIGTAESITRVLDMPGTTLIVLEHEKLGNPLGVPTAALDVIGARCSTVTVPERAGISVWRCAGSMDPA